MNELGLVTLVVSDYDEAIEFFVEKVGFELVEDSPSTSSMSGQAKRWVVVGPPEGGTRLLLAQAADERQRAAVGNQTGGRVALFLFTDDFERDHGRLTAAGVRFVREPKVEPYGTVAVWEDLYGNRWDLIEEHVPAGSASSAESTASAEGTATPAFPPPEDIGEILFTEAEIAARIADLGRRITADYAGRTPLLIAVLKGSMLFVADLMRAIQGPVEIDFLAVSSYGAATKSSGVVRIVKDLDQEISGREVIVVEDIVDSGLTLRYLLEHLGSQQPLDIKTCSLLVREGSQVDDLTIDYVGFRLPPAFVIGYGLDVDQRYRNLPYIASYAQA